ncbi:MAG: nucleoside triphosphate pyrophosphohydrolase [Terriglobales bacterium]
MIDAPFDRVVAIMHRLRAPDGCPWDRKQDFDSIRQHTIEEAYEVLEAIAERDWAALREELGDLLLQVVFYAEMAEEQQLFTIQDVLTELADKLVRRHPHVFGEGERAASPDAALARWNEMKAAEGKREDRSGMAGIPPGLPGLAEAMKMGQRAARVKFDWPDAAGVWTKLDEELGELRRAAEEPGNRRRMEEELGDVLFTLANLARHLGLDAEAASKHANQKFARRFRLMEQAAGADGGAEKTAAQWEELWQQVKRNET